MIYYSPTGMVTKPVTLSLMNLRVAQPTLAPPVLARAKKAQWLRVQGNWSQNLWQVKEDRVPLQLVRPSGLMNFFLSQPLVFSRNWCFSRHYQGLFYGPVEIITAVKGAPKDIVEK